jgi:5-methyltetrahydropteroyltriglutamate--homocysteine methyltransferase
MFRAEVVGSLLRPPYLKRARQELAGGELTRIEDRAVDEAIALQEDAGLDVVSDGELRRRDFLAPLYEGVDGAAPTPSRALTWKHAVTGEEMTWSIPFSVTGRLRPVRSATAAGYAYARAKARRPVKQSLPNPLLANWAWDAEIYPDPFELLVDATAVIREEARALARLGCEYIQIDAPDLAGFADPKRGPRHPASGLAIDRLLSDGLDLVNSIPAGIDGVTFGIHLCRGNIRSHYATSGGYERISQALFQRLTRYQTFLLEYDDERAGGFAPLADCPDDKTVVLGLISSKVSELEDPEAIARRVDAAAAHHPRERLALSTQCGFATEMEGNEITEDQQRAKLTLVAETAHRLWPRPPR